jgi:hypothetical protein
MSEILEITKAQVDFRDERDWKQFHYTKNLVILPLTMATVLCERILRNA